MMSKKPKYKMFPLKYTVFLASLILINLLPVQGEAYGKLNSAAFYNLYWSGILVGQMAVEVKETDSGFTSHAKLESRGLARTISKFWSDADADSNHYNVQWRLKKKVRTINIGYGAGGTITKDIIDPPENREKRPPVSEKMKQSTVNPLSAVVTARAKIIAAVGGGEKQFTLPLYDGRRRSTLEYEVKGETTTSFGKEKSVRVVHVTLRRIPVEGYTKNELKSMDKQEPVIDIYLDPVKLIPFKAVGTAGFGTATAYLTHECASFDECKNYLEK